MTIHCLGDLVRVRGGGTPRRSEPKYYGGGIPWVTPKDMKRPVINESSVTLTTEGVANSPAKVIDPESVLVVVRSGVLKHTLPVALTAVQVTVNQDMKALTPMGELDAHYLSRFIKANEATVLSWVRATTADNFPIEKLLQLRIDLPSLEEQRRIAAILDQADALRAKRTRSMALLNDLAQSVFLDMFGERRFSRVRAADLMPSMRNGLSPASAGQYAADVLTLSAVTHAGFDPSAVKPGLFATDPPPDKRVSAADFLMCRGNGNKALVGTGTFADQDHPELVFPDTVIAGTINTARVTLPFLDAAWRQPETRAQIESVARTTNGTYKVNQQTLSEVTIPLPSLDLQDEFGARVLRIYTQRTEADRARMVEVELFSSLQSRAFSGRL